MQFEQVTGPPQVIHCVGCLQEFTAGSEPPVTASGRPLDLVYRDIQGDGLYCEVCALKMKQDQDPTRARDNFFADTTGSVKA